MTLEFQKPRRWRKVGMWLHCELCLEKSFWPCGKHVMNQSIPGKRSIREHLISPYSTELLNAEQALGDASLQL